MAAQNCLYFHQLIGFVDPDWQHGKILSYWLGAMKTFALIGREVKDLKVDRQAREETDLKKDLILSIIIILYPATRMIVTLTLWIMASDHRFIGQAS